MKHVLSPDMTPAMSVVNNLIPDPMEIDEDEHYGTITEMTLPIEVVTEGADVEMSSSSSDTLPPGLGWDQKNRRKKSGLQKRGST